jgi:hypothetical protein
MHGADADRVPGRKRDLSQPCRTALTRRRFRRYGFRRLTLPPKGGAAAKRPLGAEIPAMGICQKI